MSEPSQVEAWIQEAREGDSLAITKLLAVYHPILRARVAARLERNLKARIDPEDILQQVCLRVVRQIQQFEARGPNSFLNWVMTIVDSRLVDAHRAATAASRDVAREAPSLGDSYWNLLDQVYSDASSPSRAARRDEAVGAVMSCLAALSEPYRQVLELRFLQGLPIAEVAERIGRSNDAVVALTRRALDALRSAMDKLGEFTRGG